MINLKKARPLVWLEHLVLLGGAFHGTKLGGSSGSDGEGPRCHAKECELHLKVTGRH